MKKINKGQVSLEAIIIIGVIVLASIIFATFYISNVNKKIDTTSNLDPNFSGMLGNDDMGSTDPIEIGGGSGPGGSEVCGDGIINGSEECDGLNFGGETCSTQGYISGSLSCTGSCTINTSGCSGSPTTSFTITSSTGLNGSIYPLGATTVNQGDNKRFTFLPNTGYKLDTVSVDGSEVSPNARASHTFNNVQSNHTIHITFKIISNNLYNILASSGSHGNINPSGDNEVLEGEDLSFTFTPNSGYRIGNVYIDSSTIGADEIELINNFSANDSQDNTFYFSEDALSFASGDDGGVSSNNNYTFENITDDHTIHVTFISNSTPTYTLEYLAGVNGSISGTTPQTVNQGNDGAQVCAVADTGYEFLKWDDGGNNACRIDENVTSNQTYTASFKDAAGQTMDMTISGVTSNIVSQPFNINVDTSETPNTVSYDLIAKIRVFNFVSGDYTLTNNCSYNGNFASTHTLETNKTPGITNYSFLCNTSGNYKFTLTATDVSLATNTVSKDHLISIENNQIIEPPVFSPNGGTFNNDTSVTINSPTSGATIRYTTNGTDPTCATGNAYSSGIQLAQENTWIKAIACKSGASSEVTTKNFKLKVATPTPNVSSGVYSNPQTITLSTVTNGATIYYSLDGQDPYYDGSIYDGTSINIYTPYTELRTIAVKNNYIDSYDPDYYYFINGYDFFNSAILFKWHSAETYISLGNKNLTHLNAELIDDPIDNLVRFDDPQLDGNYFYGGNASGNNEIDCNAFCSEKYPGGICYEYDTTSFSGNHNHLIFRQLIGDGTGINSNVNSFPHNVKGTFSKSEQWRYGSGAISGDRIEYFTCDFSHTPSPYDNGSIDLYNMPILTNDYELANRLYFPSIEVTFDDVTKINNQYTYTNLNVVGKLGLNTVPNSPDPGEMVYIHSDNFDEACTAVCDSIYSGSSCVNKTTTVKYGSRAIVYKNVSGQFSPYFPNDYYWHVPSNGFLTLYTEPVLSQVTCQVN